MQSSTGVVKPPGMKFVRNSIYKIARFSIWHLVHGYRWLLRRTTFIGITGSSGKTTAKELVHAILSTRYRGTKTKETLNGLSASCRAVLKTMPWHRFCVLEMGTGKKGLIRRHVALVPLDIGVIISIGLDHYTSFRGRELIIEEKQPVITSLPCGGTAILNADDPLIEGLAEKTAGRVFRFGQNAKADLRASNIKSNWPERLSFTVEYQGQRHTVRTRLCGTHWVSCILSAMAVGLEMKIPMEEILSTIETFDPFLSRMSPVLHADGITFICDDWKAPYWSIDHALTFMRDARADRRIMVFGTISDTPGSTPPKYRRIAHDALEFSEWVIFVGNNAHYAVAENENNPPARLKMFKTVKDASDFLDHVMRPGDLVMLKGSVGADHLLRIMLRREKEIGCWRMNCRKVLRCTNCPLLYKAEEIIM